MYKKIAMDVHVLAMYVRTAPGCTDRCTVGRLARSDGDSDLPAYAWMYLCHALKELASHRQSFIRSTGDVAMPSIGHIDRPQVIDGR